LKTIFTGVNFAASDAFLATSEYVFSSVTGALRRLSRQKKDAV
jgi:hypothetical protein